MAIEQENVTPEGDEIEEVPQWLRLLVVGLGIAIILMLALIVGTIIKRTVFAEPEVAEGTPAAAPVLSDRAERAASAVSHIAAPVGAALEDSSLSGDRLLLRFRYPSGDVSLVIVDLQTGEQQQITVGDETK